MRFKTEREMKKDTPRYVLGVSVFIGCFFAISFPMQAQNTPGVTEREILIGSCSALEGPSHFLGTETVTGAKAYFDMINDAGGWPSASSYRYLTPAAYDPPRQKPASIACSERRVFLLGSFRGIPP